jgi:hypothetical protein
LNAKLDISRLADSSPIQGEFQILTDADAAYRIGQDGNGKNGVVGYLSWVAERHPQIFFTVLLINLPPLENAESDTPEEPRRTIEEINQWFPPTRSA